MDWFSSILRERATEWYFAPLAEGQPLAAEEEYVNVFLRSLRIRDVRRGLKRFSAAVHSFIELAHLESGPVAFHTFTVPSELQSQDPKNLDRVVISSQRLLGPVPYRGGDLKIDLGLFSIETDNLLDAYVGILSDLAAAAGVGYVKAALPFVKPIENGVHRLLDASGPSILEIGLSKELDIPRVGTYVVMRAPRDELQEVELVLDSDYRLSRADGKALEYPYLTFEVTARHHREDWFAIEELRNAYTTLRVVTRSQNEPAARGQFAALRFAALTSPDLLYEDATAILATVEKELESTLRTTETAGGEAAELPDLETLQPFG